MVLFPVSYIELDGRVLPNNSLVTLPEIGTTEATSLRCVTARTDCCSGTTDGDISEWFDPRGGLATDISTFNRSRAGEGGQLGYVQLHRSSSSATLLTDYTRLTRIGFIWLHRVISWLYIVEIVYGESQKRVGGREEGGRDINGGRSGAAAQKGSVMR